MLEFVPLRKIYRKKNENIKETFYRKLINFHVKNIQLGKIVQNKIMTFISYGNVVYKKTTPTVAAHDILSNILQYT